MSGFRRCPDLNSSRSAADTFNDARLYPDLYQIFGAEASFLHEEQECSICLEVLRRRLIVTPCDHTFHQRCLQQLVRHQRRCPLCRFEFPTRWVNEHVLPLLMTGRQYWASVEDRLPPPPFIGPLLPSHQRRYNLEVLHEIRELPPWWTSQWIEDRKAEMRIRFRIPDHYRLTSADVRRCEDNGIRGIYPEWSIPSWYQPLFSDEE